MFFLGWQLSSLFTVADSFLRPPLSIRRGLCTTTPARPMRSCLFRKTLFSMYTTPPTRIGHWWGWMETMASRRQTTSM
jgi:hypothetical protein